MHLIRQFTLMGVPTIDKDHSVMNVSKCSPTFIIVHSYMIINLTIIVNCRTGYLLQHNYVRCVRTRDEVTTRTQMSKM